MSDVTLRCYGREPENIFELLGTDENSATFALGWAIEQCPSFRNVLVKTLVGRLPGRTRDMVVELQRYEVGGITDLELISENFCHVIIEAKCGWTFPSREQLAGYARRIAKSATSKGRIVSLSAATYSVASGLPDNIKGVPVKHCSWADVRRMVAEARHKTGSRTEKLWLDHLYLHLGGYVAMQNQNDNRVFVVALSTKPFKPGCGATSINLVEKRKRYFHPVGEGYPKIPPNYIGFRYRGVLNPYTTLTHTRLSLICRQSTLNGLRPTKIVRFVFCTVWGRR